MTASPAPTTELKLKVLLVDDEVALLKALTLVLQRAGHEVVALADPVEALQAAQDRSLDVALLDLTMPHVSGLDLLKELKRVHPEVEVVMMTGHATVETALAAVKGGAYDYLTKPFENIEHVALTVKKAGERKRLLDRTRHLEGLLEAKERFEDFIGQSEKMQEVFRLIEAVAPTAATVLIRGESGTGKELVARALHRKSPRSKKPFVAINCSALTETLLESELFGHVKGAFTGAVANNEGLFQAADGGTLFLDELGDMPQSTQVRLLRTLQEGEVRPVGSKESVHVDVRVIAATHVDLEAALAQGRFREDLYYRLNVIQIELPPLRARPEDVPLLAQHFLRKYAPKMGKDVQRLSEDTIETLCAHSWPGNVRELENAIERAVVLAKGPELTAQLLPAKIARPAAEPAAASLAHLPYTQARQLAQAAFDRRYLATLLQRTDGVISAAAREAQMDRSNFRRLLKQYGLLAAATGDKADEREDEPTGT